VKAVIQAPTEAAAEEIIVNDLTFLNQEAKRRMTMHRRR